jgi:hypothetical protein
VAEFTASHHNKRVFAFAMDCDPFHGDLVLGVNTESGFQQVISSKFPQATSDETDGLHGIRYRCQDFAFADFGLSEETFLLLDEIAAAQHDARTDKTAERHADTLMVMLARVVLMLEPELATLDQTDDFVAFVTERNATEASRIALMQRTISAEMFDRVFPEVRAFDDKLDHVAHLPLPQQASFWSASARDLALDHHTSDTKRFRETGVTVEDTLGTLVKLGSVAVPPLLDVLEKTATAPQLQKGKGKTAGSPTPACDFSLRTLDTLRTIRLVDEASVSRIQKLLHTVGSNGKNPGPLPLEIAKLLHELRPALFPAPKAKGTTLANAVAYQKS